MWQQADHLHIPLLDGTVSLAQVVEAPNRPDSAALCALTSRKHPPGETVSPLALSEVIAILMILPPADPAALWPIVGFDQIPRIRDVFDLDHHLLFEFADLPPQDPALIEAFVNAIHGLYPWDGFPDPDLFTNMLLTPDALPKARKPKAEFP